MTSGCDDISVCSFSSERDLIDMQKCKMEECKEDRVRSFQKNFLSIRNICKGD